MSAFKQVLFTKVCTRDACRAMSGVAAAPPALSHLQPYLDRAEELRTSSITVAYHLRVLAASAGLRHGSNAAAKAYLLDLMDAIEAERGTARPAPTDDGTVRRFALDLFHRARNSDKPDVMPSTAARNTALPRTSRA